MQGDQNVAGPQAGWEYKPEQAAPVSNPASAQSAPAPSEQSVTWDASEYLLHTKGVGWYLALAIATALLSAGAYLLTNDFVATGTILITGILFGIFAARKPQVLNYKLNASGLTIGPKFYGYNIFKSFSIIDEGAIRGIALMPLQRFMPILTVYYDPADEQKIIDVLSVHLPVEHREPDVVDKVMRKLRF